MKQQTHLSQGKHSVSHHLLDTLMHITMRDQGTLIGSTKM